MLKKILNLDSAQKITKIEQKTITGGIPECWVYTIEAECPLDTLAGICDSNRLCC
jgi:hypothetical protein